jgi:hypothetical protein
MCHMLRQRGMAPGVGRRQACRRANRVAVISKCGLQSGHLSNCACWVCKGTHHTHHLSSKPVHGIAAQGGHSSTQLHVCHSAAARTTTHCFSQSLNLIRNHHHHHCCRQSVLGSTTAGGFQLIASCWDEAMFRRLRSLQVRQKDRTWRHFHVAQLKIRSIMLSNGIAVGWCRRWGHRVSPHADSTAPGPHTFGFNCSCCPVGSREHKHGGSAHEAWGSGWMQEGVSGGCNQGPLVSACPPLSSLAPCDHPTRVRRMPGQAPSVPAMVHPGGTATHLVRYSGPPANPPGCPSPLPQTSACRQLPRQLAHCVLRPLLLVLPMAWL